MTETLIVRLNSGEDLLGKVTRHTDPDKITLKDVFQVILGPPDEATGEPKVMILPFHLFSSAHKNMSLSMKTSVAFTGKTDKPLEEYYLSITSPIIQSPSGLIGV